MPKHPYDTGRLLSVTSAHEVSCRTSFHIAEPTDPVCLTAMTKRRHCWTSGHPSQTLAQTIGVFKPEQLPIVLSTEKFAHPAAPLKYEQFWNL